MSTASGLSIIKSLLLGAGVAALFFIGSITYVLAPKLYYMKSEYTTAAVIRFTDQFVATHPGQWPRSWSDIGLGDLSRYTDIRFDLTTSAIIKDRQLIHTAIQPKCHRYRTYPHAREQLDLLYEKIASTQAHE